MQRLEERLRQLEARMTRQAGGVSREADRRGADNHAAAAPDSCGAPHCAMHPNAEMPACSPEPRRPGCRAHPADLPGFRAQPAQLPGFRAQPAEPRRSVAAADAQRWEREAADPPGFRAADLPAFRAQSATRPAPSDRTVLPPPPPRHSGAWDLNPGDSRAWDLNPGRSAVWDINPGHSGAWDLVPLLQPAPVRGGGARAGPAPQREPWPVGRDPVVLATPGGHHGSARGGEPGLAALSHAGDAASGEWSSRGAPSAREPGAHLKSEVTVIRNHPDVHISLQNTITRNHLNPTVKIFGRGL